PQQIAESAALNWLSQLLGDPAPQVGGHDVKSLLVVLTQRGVAAPAVAFDSMLSSFLLDAGEPVKLERLAQRELGWSIANEEDITKVPKGRGRLPLDEVTVEVMAQFAGMQSAVVAGVWDQQLGRLADEGLLPAWRDIEQPLIPVLAEMEARGICLDTGALAALR